MGRVVSFTVPGRPSRWQRTAGTVINPRTGKAMRLNNPKAEAQKKVIAQVARLYWKGDPVCGPVALGIEAVFRIPASWPKELQAEAMAGRVPVVADPDLSQLVKQVEDALVGIVYWDDNQVCSYRPEPVKRYGTPERTIITVSVYDQSDAAKTPGQRRLEAAAATGQMIAGRARPGSPANRSKTGFRK